MNDKDKKHGRSSRLIYPKEFLKSTCLRPNQLVEIYFWVQNRVFRKSFLLLATFISKTEDGRSERRQIYGFNKMHQHLSKSHASVKFNFLVKVVFQKLIQILGPSPPTLPKTLYQSLHNIQGISLCIQKCTMPFHNLMLLCLHLGKRGAGRPFSPFHSLLLSSLSRPDSNATFPELRFPSNELIFLHQDWLRGIVLDLVIITS